MSTRARKEQQAKAAKAAERKRKAEEMQGGRIQWLKRFDAMKKAVKRATGNTGGVVDGI